MTFEVLKSQDITIIPYLWLLSLMYDDERANINVEIEYEHNIIEYMSKPTETNKKIHFLLHPNLYSTCNYQSLHDLILGMSIKARLSNLSSATLRILSVSIKTCLGNLSATTFNRLNYPGLLICICISNHPL
jgi:hypothetical protein